MPTSSLTQKDLLQLFVSQLQDFVVVLVDTELKFSSWHIGVERNFGYTAEEFIGLEANTLLPFAERFGDSTEKEFKQAAESGVSSDTRWQEDKRGRRMYVDGVTLGLRDGRGALVGYGKIMRDVTEQKTGDEKLRAFADALDQSNVIVRQFEGMIEHWTAGCEKYYGYTAEEAVGQICKQLLKTKSTAPMEVIQQQLLTAGNWNGELEQTRKDGTRVFVSTHWKLVSDPGEPGTVVETQTDITARLLVQQELESANARLKSMALELERSNEELQEFARIASHDLSAPITSTRWLVDLLAARHGKKLEEDGQKVLQQIGQGLERMGDLIEGVLAHAHVGKSAISTEQPASAEEAVAAATENLRKQIETSGADVTLDGGLPDVRIQAQALGQLFQNLISNAIKYRRKDAAPVIKISAERDGQAWRFTVADNGSGIEPEWLERIFQAMQRRSGPEIPGSGLGLATCRKIVSRVGGRIWAESQVGVGSKFSFTLPASEPPSGELRQLLWHQSELA